MTKIEVATRDDVNVLIGLARAFYDEDGFATTNAELGKNFAVLLNADNAHLVVASVNHSVSGFALTTTALHLGVRLDR